MTLEELEKLKQNLAKLILKGWPRPTNWVEYTREHTTWFNN